MTTPLDGDAARELALAHWEHFCSRLLPGTVRRVAAWKRLPTRALADLRTELRQELAADCLEHAAQIAGQTPAERHSRWMRLAERFIYKHHVAVARHRRSAEEPVARPDDVAAAALPEPSGFDTLANGRRNVLGTARRRGLSERQLRQQLDELAADLGADGEQRAFWRTRLAEALTGLAADLLRDRGALHLVPRSRRGPDPLARVRRLRRLVARFPVQAATRPERTLLRRWARRGAAFDPAAPRQLLEAAAQLTPFASAPWLWLFEACLADGDVAAAARALRRARHAPAAGPAAAILARARLHEARGRRERAAVLVQRAAQRRPHDATLRAAAAILARARAAGPGG